MEQHGHYDVVIVGAGPAGASAAQALTGSGLKTLIMEKHPLPRYKMCSGILFPSSLEFITEVFGAVPAAARCMPEEVMGFRGFIDIDGPCMDLPFAFVNAAAGNPELPSQGLNIRRPELDSWLCGESDASILDDCTFTGFERQGESLLVLARRAGVEVRIAASYLVGADGPASPVRAKAFPGFDEGLRLIPNYEEWYRGEIDLEPGWLYLFFDRGLSGFMATVFHKDGSIVAATGAPRGESARRYFLAFREHLADRHGLRVETAEARHGIVLNDMSATGNLCLGRGNVLLAGEAAGFLRSAEGITPALVTGKAAGEAILESLENGISALEPYSRATEAEREACRREHRLNEDATGFNMFTRV